MPASLRRRPVLTLAVVAAAGALALSGCSSDAKESQASDQSSGTPSATTSPSPSTTVSVPPSVTLTDQGSKLSFGDTASVVFEPDQKKGSALDITVDRVRQGSLSDFRGFILDDSYKKKADYFYVDVTVKNVGKGDVGGVPVPVWGVSSSNTLLPPVNFTTTFTKCPSRPLPASFGPGASVDTCLVYLSPDKGGLDAVSYRPNQQFDPITWTGKVEQPSPTAKPKARKKG